MLLLRQVLQKDPTMDIHTKLLEDMKQAMRDKDATRLGVIRFLRSEIQNYEIDHGKQDDAGVEKLVASMVKKMTDAVSEFAAAAREDLVVQEQEKIAILQTYLPEQLSDAELQEIISQTAAESSEQNIGKLIGLVVQKVGSKADGSRVSALVRQHLAS